MGTPTRECPRCNGSGGEYIVMTKRINGIKQDVEEWKPCCFCHGSGMATNYNR